MMTKRPSREIEYMRLAINRLPSARPLGRWSRRMRCISAPAVISLTACTPAKPRHATKPDSRQTEMHHVDSANPRLRLM